MSSFSIGRQNRDEATLFSLGRALVLAGARLLELDNRELNVELKASLTCELSILLYDTFPEERDTVSN